MSARETPETVGEFSLTSGGLLYRLLLSLRLVKPPMEYLRRRVVVVTAVAWLPLLVLSAIAGTAVGGVDVPFLYDISTHARFLVALPLLLFAEVVVHRDMQPIVGQFLVRGIVPPDAEPQFRALIAAVQRWRDSSAVEVLLFVLTQLLGHFVADRTALQASTWSSTLTATASSATNAGLWLEWISIPIFQFILLRWLFRWILWVGFLWRVTRLPLVLTPTHPDRAAGLSFLSRTVMAFVPALAALSTIVAGVLASRVLYEGAPLPSFKFEAGVTVLLVAIFSLGPLCVFTPLLARTRRTGEFEYGVLATRYVLAYDRKWNKGGHAPGEEFLGSADIQSLADLSNSYSIVDEMRAVPFDKNAIMLTAACAILPLAPLVLFIVPLDQLIVKVLGILF